MHEPHASAGDSDHAGHGKQSERDLAASHAVRTDTAGTFEHGTADGAEDVPAVNEKELCKCTALLQVRMSTYIRRLTFVSHNSNPLFP